MNHSVLAIAAHPDDIEFVMAGTLLRLIERGWKAHYFNLANGCCGSAELSRQACADVRLREAQAAASLLPATFHFPICNDLEIFYDASTHRRVTQVVREVQPSIILTHALADYMEDHQNTARLAVGGAFARGMPNFPCEAPVYDAPVAVYHAQPHGNRDPLGSLVRPTHFVDVTDLRKQKTALLSCHASQGNWLDASQKMHSHVVTMLDLNHEVGELSDRFGFAEGWRQHIHFGLSSSGFDPLHDSLGQHLYRRK